MLRTIILLILTLIALPIIALKYDTPLNPAQWAALQSSFYLMIGVALTCFVVSEWTKNYSQVDKIWSTIPVVYAWFFVQQSDWNVRMVIMAVLVTLWAIRLTYNFSRRGGYHWIPWKGEEDYRWGVLRQNPLFQRRINWILFGLFFISLYQNTLIWLFNLPIVVAWQGTDRPLNALDFVAIILFLGLLLLEYIADQQQYVFQTEKYRRIAAGETLDGDYARGFRTTGLWGLVRHPNYAAEQGIWLVYYLFSVAATGRWFNWSLTGAILLVLLFLGSSDFSEKISSGKYPEYRDYQQKTPRFIPWKLS
jgi:steroid 5-alpha reductase family enzyme